MQKLLRATRQTFVSTFRYFGTSPAKFGILTNGIIYRFYTDLEESNKMDLVPFLEIDMANLKDSSINELKNFVKIILIRTKYLVLPKSLNIAVK